MASFTRRRRDGAAVTRFTPAEAAILRSLVTDVDRLLTPMPPDPGRAAADPLEELTGLHAAPGPVELPADPALARLLPDAYRDDPDAAAEHRRFTEGELRNTKRAAAARLLATLPVTGGKVALPESDAEAWLAALNDVRLALAVRLDVTDDTDSELRRLSPEDPRAHALALYGWLGWLQETLVEAVSG